MPDQPSLLTICCSKGRPERIKDMLLAFECTKKGNTDIIICLDYKDPKIRDYDYLRQMYNIHERSPNFYGPSANEIVSIIEPNYDFYSLIDDDFIPRTKGWDEILVNTVIDKGNGWGIAYANDLWPESSVDCRHPCIPVMSRKFIDTVGHIVLPGLNNFSIDTYMRDLTEPLGLLFYCPEVIIEHMHIYNKGKGKMDSTYEWSYCPEEQNNGAKYLGLWRRLQMKADHKRILNATQKEGMDKLTEQYKQWKGITK